MANMHQRLALQCGWRLDYHVKRKIDHGPVRKIFFSFPDPNDYEIKGSGHHTSVFCMI